MPFLISDTNNQHSPSFLPFSYYMNEGNISPETPVTVRRGIRPTPHTLRRFQPGTSYARMPASAGWSPQRRQQELFERVSNGWRWGLQDEGKHLTVYDLTLTMW